MITDLAVIDRLTTRARRGATALHLEVLDGPDVLHTEMYTNPSNVTLSEIDALLANTLANYIRGGVGRPVNSEYIVGGQNVGAGIVIGTAAPNNADGRPDGTIYVRVAA